MRVAIPLAVVTVATWVATSVAMSAAANDVPTGKAVEVEQRNPTLILWVLQGGGAEYRVTVLGGSARVGDAVDVVDMRGHVGRATVSSVEAMRCQSTTYLEARIRFEKALRRPVGQMVALMPALPHPARARMLRPSEVADPPPRGRAALQALDADGDGTADAARYVLYNCDLTPPRTEGRTCVENWNREGYEWRLVSAVEFRPPCR